MNTMRILLVPSMLLVAIVAYVVLNPSTVSVANPDATPTTRPAATETPVPDLPEGVTGRLTYRTGRERVTVRLPELIEEQRYIPAPEPADAPSSFGWWVRFLGDDSCVASVLDDDRGPAAVYVLEAQSCSSVEWSLDRNRVAFTALTHGNRNQLIVVEGESPVVRVVFDSPTSSISTLAWAGGERLLVSGVFDGRAGIRWLSLGGALTTIADVPQAPFYFYPSPDRSRFLFTQDAPDGWQLWMFDATTNAITNLGSMGSDPANVAPPVESSPENTGKGGPMYIAWSPNGAMVAFGGGFEPPYVMTTVHVDTAAAVVTEFPSGYPGEIRWTADSTKIGVSTYDIERTHHETWVVDPITGAGRHLMDGCVIVWSPDSRFLAVHGEDRPGIAIVDVESGERGQLTHRADDAPIGWTE